jgi:hypothetical protein
MRLSTMSMHIQRQNCSWNIIGFSVQRLTARLYSWLPGDGNASVGRRRQVGAGNRRARTICWATARMYRLSSGWEWQICFLHACGFRIMANTVEEASCRCPVESQHWAKGPQTSNSWVRIRFAPISSLGSKRARVQLSAYCMSHANPACRIKELFSCFHGDLSSSKWRTCQESQLRIMHADKYNAV